MIISALECLATLYEKGKLPQEFCQANSILFQRATFHPLLLKLKPVLQCTQTFKPDYDQLLKVGTTLLTALPSSVEATLFIPTRQKVESLALMAQAYHALKEQGIFLACAENGQGAKSYREYLAKLTNAKPESIPAQKCTIFWCKKDSSTVQKDLLTTWEKQAQPFTIADTPYTSQAGIYGWNKVDLGSALLAKSLGTDLKGSVADFGAGYGYLSEQLLTQNPNVTSLDLYEAEKLALTCAQKNLSKFEKNHPAKIAYHWADLSVPLQSKKYDCIIMNPPCHDSGMQSLELGECFIEQAATQLKKNGILFLVANVTLPYEKTLNKLYASHARIATAKGFKVLRAAK